MRLPIRDKRQFFIAPCLFYFTVQRSRENMRKPSTFTYIIIVVACRSRLSLEQASRNKFQIFITNCLCSYA